MTTLLITIVSDVTFVEGGPNIGSFTTSGDAADSGSICPAGSFEDTGIRFAGGQADRGIVQLQVYKTFTCDDGSGTFDVTLRYAVSRAQWGWLRVYSRSAMDGSIENLREYPVWFPVNDLSPEAIAAALHGAAAAARQATEDTRQACADFARRFERARQLEPRLSELRSLSSPQVTEGRS